MSQDLPFSYLLLPEVDEAIKPNPLTNRPESKSFLTTALALQGSVTSRVMPRVAIVAAYALTVNIITLNFPSLSLSITPFEYSGAVLGLLLVLRVNAGHDRWWEARKIWGSIVNQSRNLSIVVHAYGGQSLSQKESLIRWIAAWPHVMRESLRNTRNLIEVSRLIGKEDANALKKSENMSMYVAVKIASSLALLRQSGLDSFAFHRAESERSLLIDAIGACERIKNTRMPLVLAIKTRRFILSFLVLLPFALADRTVWSMPLIVAMVSYPLFSLDEIGAELQNPFSSSNLSHLPLDSICETISKNVMALLNRNNDALPKTLD